MYNYLDAAGGYTAIRGGDTDDFYPNVYGIIIDWPRISEVSFEMHLPAGWSLISLPVNPHSTLVKDLFPDAVAVYDYEMDLGYKRVKALEVEQGYWIFVMDDHDYILKGEPIIWIQGGDIGYTLVMLCMSARLPYRPLVIMCIRARIPLK